MPIYLFLPLAILISLSLFSVCYSSPFSTLSISRTEDKTIVCALVLQSSSSNTTDLVCTSFPYGEPTNYSSEGDNGYTGPIQRHVQYSAVATADGFLCGVKPSTPGKFSMMWWHFDNENTWDDQRVYWGPLLALSAGDSHVCGLTDGTGSLKCWWWEEVDSPPGTSFRTIAVGGEFVCGITICGGLIRCFGTDTDVVGKEPEGSFQILAAGSYHACAVSVAGNLTCWGSGAPKIDSVPDDLIALSLGTNTTCILTSNGTVKCWGLAVQPPKSVAEEIFLSIEANGDLVCGVLMSNFSVICWGSKNFKNSKYKVYEQILPGTCSLAKNCTCGPMSGSAHLCDEGHVICQPCVIALSNSKINVPAPPASPSPVIPTDSNRMRSVMMTIGIAGAALATSVALAGFLVYKVKKKKQNYIFDPTRINPIVGQPNPNRSPTSLLPRNGFVSAQFTFQTLNRATDGFAEGNKIGSGGFGTVYWGVLPDGRQAALKRAHRKRRRHVESAFLSELALLSRLNHKNLVGLMGFCEDRGERVLVVEYMPNGTLYEHLHSRPPSDSSPFFTSWAARLKIALDAARGIEYLHSYAVPGIIHRDIKPSNILLDSTWTAKVSDFGLSMTRTAGNTGASTSTTSAGTVGYMDPESFRGQELSEKSDVYSFGVVLLEIITGLKVIFKMEEDDEPPQHVKEYVMSLLCSGDTERIFDKRIPMRNAREEEAVNTVVQVAVKCVRAQGRSRPVMKEVVMDLEWALGLCCSDEDDTVEVVLEVEDRGSRSTVSSMSTIDLE